MSVENSLFNNGPEAITLTQLTLRIADTVNAEPELHRQWVVAETSDVSVRKNGHCYLELIEKNEDGLTVARLSAAIWRTSYVPLAALFQAVTGQSLATGMKVMVCVTVNFHPQFGLKAVIGDIIPEFTLGDMARQRQEIIKRLTVEGIIDRNKQLPWTLVPQRIAVISSETAAGYGDFMNQLENNAYGLKFYTHLFTAAMQGANTVPSVMAALQRVEEVIDLFDCLVVIRGGGASSELNSFDNYDLARAIAMFPIPVIVGIGHERDVTVLDYVASMRVKTPTAAAEFLIKCGIDALAHLDELHNAAITAARDMVAHSREQLAYYASLIPATAQRIASTARARLDKYVDVIPAAINTRIGAEGTRLSHNVELIRASVGQALVTAQMRLQSLDDKVTLLSPRNILNRGYSLTKCNGKFVTSSTQLHEGDIVTTHFKNGSVRAEVKLVKQ